MVIKEVTEQARAKGSVPERSEDPGSWFSVSETNDTVLVFDGEDQDCGDLSAGG